ncbi:MAG: helix-turn-helix domain-containing protein [Treponema sp.]|nr:helix-turn-helix domain-containing protein [Treponema sp.]
MQYYITYGEFQNRLKSHFLKAGNKLQFEDLCEYISHKDLFTTKPQFPDLEKDYDNLSDTEFDKVIDSIPLTLSELPSKRLVFVEENNLIPQKRDVFVIRHPRYTCLKLHEHDYFEINYVVNGECLFYFEKESRKMSKGEFFIISPKSKHDVVIEDESIVFTISIRKSTFNATFFSLLSRQDLLSNFFRTILQNQDRPNYLVFNTEENALLKHNARLLVLESYTQDVYSNSCCINYLNLMFTSILRNYSKTIQMYDYHQGSDFSRVLQYIQYNYRTLTLSSLADFFNYTEPYLCTLIKQNTGYNYSDLIKEFKLNESEKLLANTDLRISEIAEQVGYNSADHFSKMFKEKNQISPVEYRKANKVSH